MENELTLEEKKKIFNFVVPYVTAGKIHKMDVEKFLGVEDDPYQRIEIGMYAKLQNSELHNQIQKEHELKYGY